MRSFFWVAAVSVAALVANSSAQEPKKDDKAEATKGLFMVTGLH
jgi:hypothetical protein